jgi:uncharacterized protein with HEPN domain
MKNDQATLLDIALACRRIGRHLAGVEPHLFHTDEKTQDAIIRQIEIIGEAAKRLSPAFRDAHPHLPWKAMAGMRDVLIHQYDQVLIPEVWSTATVEVPAVLAAVEPLLHAGTDGGVTGGPA